jgi:hypothetical protein
MNRHLKRLAAGLPVLLAACGASVAIVGGLGLSFYVHMTHDTIIPFIIYSFLVILGLLYLIGVAKDG